MEKITLEKVDKVIERTFVSYKDAKEALEEANGDILDAIIIIEDRNQAEMLEEKNKQKEFKVEKEESIDEVKSWMLNLINKGTVSRIKVKKDGDQLLDIPVNAGVAAGVIAVTLPPILIGAAVAVVGAKLTIEITKTDGSVEVVNKLVKEKAQVLKETSKFATGIASTFLKFRTTTVKSKYMDNDERNNIIQSIRAMNPKTKARDLDENSNFSYTVNFEDVN